MHVMFSSVRETFTVNYNACRHYDLFVDVCIIVNVGNKMCQSMCGFTGPLVEFTGNI